MKEIINISRSSVRSIVPSTPYAFNFIHFLNFFRGRKWKSFLWLLREGLNSFPAGYMFYHFTLANTRRFYSSKGGSRRQRFKPPKPSPPKCAIVLQIQTKFNKHQSTKTVLRVCQLQLKFHGSATRNFEGQWSDVSFKESSE